MGTTIGSDVSRGESDSEGLAHGRGEIEAEGAAVARGKGQRPEDAAHAERIESVPHALPTHTQASHPGRIGIAMTCMV